MNTGSIEFLGFGIAAAVLYNLCQPVAWRQAVLLVANLCFLATFAFDAKACLPLAGFLLLGYLGLRLMQYHSGRKAFVPLLIAIIGAFFWLKKYTFLPAASFLHFAYATIGLSYIFFRVLHLVIEAHSDELPDPIGVASYLNYTLNFLTLVSGPIQRYQDFAATHLAEKRPPLNVLTVGQAIDRVAVGCFKVLVAALVFSAIQKQALGALSLAQPFGERVLTGVEIAVSYPFYLFCNFSGYTDTVIGLGKLLRFALPENFDRPFSSDNFMNFWSRWHMTLSQWLKSYVYNPLLIALMRTFPSPSFEPFFAVFALFVAFFLVGVWHGRTSEFLVFGLLQGGGVAANQLYQILMIKSLGRKKFKAISGNRVYQALSRGLTFTFFTFSLFWFWSTWTQMRHISEILRAPGLLAVWLAIFGAATLVLEAYELLRSQILSIKSNDEPILLSRYARTVIVTALVVITVAVTSLLNVPAPDIVYKSF